MFKIHNADYLTMPEEKSQFRGLAVPVIIFISWVSFAILAYFVFVSTAATKDPVNLAIAQGFTILAGICAVIMTLGALGRRAGWTKEELDKWGDDMLAGKPPI